jgi:hypothetical protein
MINIETSNQQTNPNQPNKRQNANNRLTSSLGGSQQVFQVSVGEYSQPMRSLRGIFKCFVNQAESENLEENEMQSDKQNDRNKIK